MAATEMKHQEYLLERSLQKLNIEKALDEMSKAVEQLSIGPFIFKPQYDSLWICIAGDHVHAYVKLRNRAEMISKKMFLIEITRALRDLVRQDFSERIEVNRGYARLILQLIKDSDVYDCIVKAFEHHYTALKALEEVERNLQDWNDEVMNRENS